jgi:hypothetical protein
MLMRLTDDEDRDGDTTASSTPLVPPLVVLPSRGVMTAAAGGGLVTLSGSE